MKDPRLETSSSNNASSCECVEERIHDLMDLRQPLLSDEIVREHIASCDECVELVVDLGALNESLTQIPLETLNRLTGLAAGPLPEEVATRSHLHPLSFITSVACLLLVMLTSGVWFSNGSDDSGPHRIKVRNHEVVSVPYVKESSSEPVVPRQLVFLPTAHKTTPPSEFLNAVSFEQISGGVEPFQNYLNLTCDLPGIRPITNSVNATFHLIKSIAAEPSPPEEEKSPEDGPNVGFHDSSLVQLCCV